MVVTACKGEVVSLHQERLEALCFFLLLRFDGGEMPLADTKAVPLHSAVRFRLRTGTAWLPTTCHCKPHSGAGVKPRKKPDPFVATAALPLPGKSCVQGC